MSKATKAQAAETTEAELAALNALIRELMPLSRGSREWAVRMVAAHFELPST